MYNLESLVFKVSVIIKIIYCFNLTLFLMAIDLFFTRLSPPSRAVLMTIKQLNIAVNLKEVDLRNGQHLTDEYAKV